MKKIWFFICLIAFLSFVQKSKNPITKSIEKQLALIPSGTVTIGYDTTGVPIRSFYLQKTEVSNAQYIEFIEYTKKNNPEKLKEIFPDTNVWVKQLHFGEFYKKIYLFHSVYADYPIVGVSKKQAEAFCDWLTIQYNAQAKKKFSKVKFRLPSQAEWQFAAGNGRQDIFPWGGIYMRNSKGMYLANFIRIADDALVKIDGKVQFVINLNNDTLKPQQEVIPFSNDLSHSISSSFITTPVVSYFPNKFGLYNMAGNVAEFVQEYGITQGGSWLDYGYSLRNNVASKYDEKKEVSVKNGFRVAMEIVP